MNEDKLKEIKRFIDERCRWGFGNTISGTLENETVIVNMSKVLYDEVVRCHERVKEIEAERDKLSTHLKWAEELINFAIDKLMEAEEVGEWEGVRCWQETYPDNDGVDLFEDMEKLMKERDEWKRIALKYFGVDTVNKVNEALKELNINVKD